MPFIRLVLAMFTFVLLTGCAPTVADLRNDLDLHRSSFSDKLISDRAGSQQFLACLNNSHGDRLQPADQTIGPVRTLIQRLREKRPLGTDSLLPLQETFLDMADRSSRRLNLTTLRHVVEAIERWHGHIDFDEDALIQDASRFTRLLSAYNKAYFGDLRFNAAQTDPRTALRSVVRRSSRGFVDRSGNVLRFPGLSQDLSPASAQIVHDLAPAATSQRVSADLARIFLEAFFDAAFEVPAVHGATALEVDWATQDHPYPELDAAHPGISLNAWARITRDALRAEAAVTSQVGKLVRGGSLFGTQNETVAATLETAAGVMAKKIVEHEEFCYFLVTQQQDAAPPVAR
jgi:hypothetical protein